jgi:hypothetical protein
VTAVNDSFSVQPDSRRAPVEPPYLLTAVTDRRGVGVVVHGDAGMAVAEVSVHGEWSPRLGERASSVLRLCLAGPSASIIVDLQDLEDPYGVSLQFWLAVWRQARLAAEPVQVTFALPTTAALSRRLRYLRGPQPRVFATVPEARIAVAERIPRSDRLQARLEPRPSSVRAARALADQACQAWNLENLLEDIRLVVSELAANAVEHAGTDFIVTVSRRGPRVHVAIHDHLRRFPRPSPPNGAGPRVSLGERGRGLHLVHATAAAWGAMPARDGKVVWATVT